MRIYYAVAVPSKPQIAIGKCSRSMHSVVLVLCSPEASDVIDEYRVYYSTPQQQTLGQQVRVPFSGELSVALYVSLCF